MILVVGTVLGFLTGLGIGGGSLLILWLTAVLHMDPGIARGINLLFFIPGAFIACIFRKKQGDLNLKRVLPAALAGCAAAALCSYFSTFIHTDLLQKLFGLLLLAAGIKELFTRKK